MITVKELLNQENFFDYAIVRHGFTDYMRDYQIMIHFGYHSGNAIHKYQFIGCVEATYTTALSPQTFLKSLPDKNVLVDLDAPSEEYPDGFIWAVRFAEVYPGWTYVEDGERANHWSDLLGRKMHELLIEANAFTLRLVFGDLRVAFVGKEPEFKLEHDDPLPITDRTSDGGIE